jgi:DNA-binding SARP family transcriptional activator/tetratricopeptide (TPR) repeat protein
MDPIDVAFIQSRRPAPIISAMHVPPTLSAPDLAALTDPEALLEHARALEPALRLSERAATLDRLEQVLADGQTSAPPPGRNWRLETVAERAIDASSLVQLDVAAKLADEVLSEADPSFEIAILRALTARARLLAWTGTEEATRQADALFLKAIERCRGLGRNDWLGHLMFWRAQTVFFQNGELERAAVLMREALIVLGQGSPRRSTVLTFYADALIALGEWDAVIEVLDEAQAVASRDQDIKSRAYVAWSRAHLASLSGDALTTERQLREVERDAGDWFEMDIGVTFLADAAEMLDRVGLAEQAERYLARATAREPDNEFVRQARATLLARSGNPWEGIESLQALARGDWLEKRLLWRHMLLSAWAEFRAGRADAGLLAARALELAGSSGGLRVAEAGEPEIVRALAPLAARVGSAPARELLLGDRAFEVRLFGTPTVTRADGSNVDLPRGKPGELVRMLALYEHGLQVEVVLEHFFPEVSLSTSRHRLRQVLLRLRVVADDLVTREGDHLKLAPAWVDVREFLAAADRMRAAPGPRAIQLAYAALAIRSGPLLPTDEYANWAHVTREHVEYRHLTILDRIASDAASRGSHQEALTALDALLKEGYAESEHYATVRKHLLALGRVGTVSYLDDLSAENPRSGHC